MAKTPSTPIDVTTTDDEPEYTPPPRSGSDRVRATKLRNRVRTGNPPLTADELNWLNEYEAHVDDAKVSKGASRARTVKYEETDIAAEGTGEAAMYAAAAASSREEGRRYDKLLDGAVRALTAACTLHETMASTLLARAVEDGNVMRDLMGSVREHYLERTRLEADNIRREALDDVEKEEPDEITKMARELLPELMPAIMEHLRGRKKG